MCDVFFFQAEDGIRDHCVTGVQTCALPISDILAGAVVLMLLGFGLRAIYLSAGPAPAGPTHSHTHGATPGSASVGPWARSEERRVGKECRSRGSPYH